MFVESAGYSLEHRLYRDFVIQHRSNTLDYKGLVLWFNHGSNAHEHQRIDSPFDSISESGLALAFSGGAQSGYQQLKGG